MPSGHTRRRSQSDPRLAANLAGASAAGVRAGAYHFSSFESAGATDTASHPIAKTLATFGCGFSYGQEGLAPEEGGRSVLDAWVPVGARGQVSGPLWN